MFSFPEACKDLSFPLIFPQVSKRPSGVSIDTRTLVPGDFFVALKGTRQDGHLHLEEAFRRGAHGAIIETAYFRDNIDKFHGRSDIYRNLMLAEDVLAAFQQLAVWYRKQFSPFTVGITGSVGKTSTKEFLHYLFSLKGETLATAGNFNNHLGLPLTLFRLRPQHQFLIAELGANHEGEIAALTKLLLPDAGILTQISPAHLEGFGSLEGIYRAKTELFAALPVNSYVVIPDDDHELDKCSQELSLKAIRVGLGPHADFRITQLKINLGFVEFQINHGAFFRFQGLAPFLVKNAAMAMAMADVAGVHLRDVPTEWSSLKLPAGRFEKHELENGVIVIYDGYNASPKSFEAAVETLKQMSIKGKKCLVIADMLELGQDEEKYHTALGEKISETDVQTVLGYGERIKVTLDTIRKKNSKISVLYFEDKNEIGRYVGHHTDQGDVVLMKASRGMKIEEVLNGLKVIAAQKSLRIVNQSS